MSERITSVSGRSASSRSTSVRSEEKQVGPHSPAPATKVPGKTRTATEPRLVRIGTAGWTIPRPYAAAHRTEGSHLERYARTFLCTEINQTFYRSPMPSTYLRWAASVPEGFRFSVKAPKAITHESALACSSEALGSFLREAKTLGAKLGPILLQLPPKLAFEPARARTFFTMLRDLYPGATALEPRHASWFSAEADQLLVDFKIGRVAADPPRVTDPSPRVTDPSPRTTDPSPRTTDPSPRTTDPARAASAQAPGGSKQLAYYRLHGSPRMYYSAYTPEFLEALAAGIRQQTGEVWCIFDNTASGAALGDAQILTRLLDSGASREGPAVEKAAGAE